MAAVQCVQVQSAGVVGWDKLGPDVVLGEAVVHTQILDPRCKSLIKPQMGPPFLYIHTEDVTVSSKSVQILILTMSWNINKLQYFLKDNCNLNCWLKHICSTFASCQNNYMTNLSEVVWTWPQSFLLTSFLCLHTNVTNNMFFTDRMNRKKTMLSHVLRSLLVALLLSSVCSLCRRSTVDRAQFTALWKGVLPLFCHYISGIKLS